MSELKRCRSYTELCSRFHKFLNEPLSGIVNKMDLDIHTAKVHIFKMGDKYWKKLSFLTFNYKKLEKTGDPINTHIINNCPFCAGYLEGEDVTEWYLEELEKARKKREETL